MKFDSLNVPEIKFIKCTDDYGTVYIMYVNGKLSGSFFDIDDIHCQVHKIINDTLRGV